MSTKPGITKYENPTRWVIKPQALNIACSDGSRYWESGEDDSATLRRVCWFEVTGLIDENLKEGSYNISFKVRMNQEVFGWETCPVFVMAKIGRKGRYIWQKIKLPVEETKEQFEIPYDEMTIHVPQGKKAGDTKLYFGLYEVWTGKWKGGLEIYEVEVVKKGSQATLIETVPVEEIKG